MPGNITILSGPIGAGKSTVARELIDVAPAGLVYIEGDTFWSFIAKPASERKVNENFTMIMRAMTASARHCARDGYAVVLDFSIPPWYLDGVRALLQGQPFDYVVLRPSEAVCVARAAARAEGTIADYEPYRELYRSFDAAQRHIISDDDADPATLARRIEAERSRGTFRIS